MKSSAQIRQEKGGRSGLVEPVPELIRPRTFWIAAAVIAAVLFGVYSPTLNFQFILDDTRFLADPRIRTSGHIWEYFSTYVWAQVIGGASSFYRPIFVLWLRFNFIINEMSSWGWHLFSIAKHACVAILLGLLVWKLLRDRVAVLMAASLFALHPSNAESVAWVTVPDALMAALMLASILFLFEHVDCLEAAGPPKVKSAKKLRKSAKAGTASFWWLLASAGACFAALLTKETALVLPAMLYGTLVCLPIDREDSTADPPAFSRYAVRFGTAFRTAIPFFCVLVLYFLMRGHALEGTIVAQTQHLPLVTLLLASPGVLWFYAKVLLWPVQSHAFGNTDDIGVVSTRTVFIPALGVAVCGALLAWLVLWCWKKTQELPRQPAVRIRFALTSGVLFLNLPLLLVLNLDALNPGDFLHGRYAYLSLIGLVLLLVTAWSLSGKWRRPLVLVAGTFAIAFAALTVLQEGMWQNDLSIFTVGHQIAPRNKVVARNFARAKVEDALKLTDEGRCSEGVPIFEEGTREFPEDWVPWAALGDCYYHMNDLPKAEAYMHRAADLAHMPRVTEQWEHVRAEMLGQR